MIELKPCPFCSSEDVGLVDIGEYMGEGDEEDRYNMSAMECANCQARGPAYTNNNETLAIDRWNGAARDA